MKYTDAITELIDDAVKQGTLDDETAVLYKADLKPPRDVDARSANADTERYHVKKREYEYNRYNSLRGRSTNDPESLLWRTYFELEDAAKRHDTPPDDLAQDLRDAKYAIAAADYLEELAAMFYHNEVMRLPGRAMRKKLAEIRWNTIHAKKGGRFRRGDNTPPTHYRDL